MDNGHYSLDCLSGKNVRQTLSLLCPSLRFEVINLEANKSSLSQLLLCTGCSSIALLCSTGTTGSKIKSKLLNRSLHFSSFCFLSGGKGAVTELCASNLLFVIVLLNSLHNLNIQYRHETIISFHKITPLELEVFFLCKSYSNPKILVDL